MKKINDYSPLLGRLNLIIDMTQHGLSGGELGQLILIALGQQDARYEMNLSRAGRKKSLDNLLAYKLVELVNDEPHLAAELCAKYGISVNEDDSTGSELLQRLTKGLALNKTDRKNLYLCNSYGEPASEEELKVLHSQLFNAAVCCAAKMDAASEQEVHQAFRSRQWECSRELEMKGFASVVQGCIDRKFKLPWPGSLSRAVYAAIFHAQLWFPPVLDPHTLLEQWKDSNRKLHERMVQLYASGEAAKTMQEIRDRISAEAGKGGNEASSESAPQPANSEG